MFLVRFRGIAEKRRSLSRERPPRHIGHQGHALQDCADPDRMQANLRSIAASVGYRTQCGRRLRKSRQYASTGKASTLSPPWVTACA